MQVLGFYDARVFIRIIKSDKFIEFQNQILMIFTVNNVDRQTGRQTDRQTDRDRETERVLKLFM